MMSTYEALVLMISFASLVVTIITVSSNNKKK
ncbi:MULTISPECIES: putative holin-like toxin [Bacillales]|nr:putative holin-like toxin [Alkalihalobacillus algicola]MCA0986973.1 putative holin-like toxin [Alkalihalobacillus algicola]